MTSLGLAWRTARRYRARTLLAVAGVAIIGALLFDMLLLSRGLLASFADLLDSEGFDGWRSWPTMPPNPGDPATNPPTSSKAAASRSIGRRFGRLLGAAAAVATA